MTQQVYLVWSNEAHSWWRANGSGYTGDVWAAGRYDEAEAVKACGMRTWSLGAPPPEVKVLAPEDGRDTFTVDDIRAVSALMQKRIADATWHAIATRTPASSPRTYQKGTCAMAKFEIGDKVAMAGVPVTVEVTGLGACDGGDNCPLGTETFSFQDPGGMGEDWMHTSEFEKAGN